MGPTPAPDRLAVSRRKTLTRWTIENEHLHDDRNPTGNFSGLLNAVATAIKVIANHVNKGALLEARPVGGGLNVQGELQKPLDVLSNEVMVEQTEWTGYLAALASEEMEDLYAIPSAYARGHYLLVFDPLDGSSNLDVNMSVGTIFSILRAPSTGQQVDVSDFLQPGTEQVCGGFALYGPSTVLVLTTGDGVDGFTLDRDIGAFVLTHPKMRIPDAASEFAINSSNARFWEAPVQRYVRECLEGSAGERGKDFNMRWVASLVAEAFRILTRGGVFLYPADTKDPTKQGRLRLLYEANPIAYIVEQAGGRASTGRARIMALEPSDLHQRVPLIFGSAEEVDLIERYHRQPTAGAAEGFDASLFNARSLFQS
jgi:fructose-1,6-bisphosphatase I/sedoheptulose-1,7-bisphosphatase